MPFTPDYAIPKEREPYYLEGGPVGCLMLHGFMGSPLSSHPMADYLNAHGVTMHCPLLPGHGEYPFRMAGYSRHDWLQAAEDGLARLQPHVQDIFLMGHSMGTILAAHLVHKYSALPFRGLIMLAPAYLLPDRRLHAFRFLRYVMRWFYPWDRRSYKPVVRQRLLDFDPTIDLDDPERQDWIRETSRLSTAALDEMRRIFDYGRKTLWPRLSLPVLVFQGGHDIATTPERSQRLLDALPAHEKAMQVYPEAGHELMRPFSPVHQDVWERALAFMRRWATQPLPDARSAAP